MKPLNQKERSTLYWQFLILYLVTIVLIIFAVSFYYEVNDKEVKILRAQKESFKSFEQTPRIMYEKIKQLDSLLIQLSDPKQSSDMIEDNIKRVLNDMPSLGKDNQTSLDSLFDRLRKNYFGILEDKRNIRTSAGASDLVSKYNEEINKLQKDLDLCTKKNDILEMKLNIQQGR